VRQEGGRYIDYIASLIIIMDGKEYSRPSTDGPDDSPILHPLLIFLLLATLLLDPPREDNLPG